MVDALIQWCADHQAEIQAYAGQYVAISPQQGILAHGVDFRRVYDEAVRKDPAAVFQLVPDAGLLVLWLR